MIATRPATTPEAAPSEVPLPSRIFSTISQPSIAAQVASVVFSQTRPVSVVNWASMSPSSAETNTIEPTLKPNQPNHSRPAPIMVSVRLCGRMGSLPKPLRTPMRSARTRPATPALMCTTVPPA